MSLRNDVEYGNENVTTVHILLPKTVISARPARAVFNVDASLPSSLKQRRAMKQF